MATKKTAEESTVNETAAAKADESTVNETAAQAEDERVEVYVPRGNVNDESNLHICVNGVNFLLPKGKTSKVPKYIAEEFYRSQKAQEALDKRVDELLEASK